MYRFIDYKELFKPYEIIDYLRKSQSDDPLSTVEEVLAKHESILDEWDMRHLGELVPVENRYREVVSGETISERPEINKVLRLIESPKIKAVKVVEPQRLTRGDLEDIGYLMKIFKHTNTYIITPERMYDLHDEYDWNAFEAELKRGNDYLKYVKKIMERGRLVSVSQGNYINSEPPYGYRKVKIKDGKKEYPTLEIVPEQADIVRMIFTWYANESIGRQNICYRLDEMGFAPPRGKKWNAKSILEMLKNVHYIGKVKWNCRPTQTIVENGQLKKTRPQNATNEVLIFDGKHKPIIDTQLWKQVQTRLGNNPRVNQGEQLINPLSGLMFCNSCGRTMSLKKYVYKDGRTKCAPRYCCIDQSRCGSGSATVEEVLNIVCGVLKSSIQDFEIKVDAGATDNYILHQNLIANLKNQLEKLERKELSQWEQQAHPDPEQRMPPEIFKKLNERLLDEKKKVKNALIIAYETAPKAIDYTERTATFTEALDALQNSNVDAAAKNELLKACIERIDFYREKPTRKKNQNWSSPPIELDIKLKL